MNEDIKMHSEMDAYARSVVRRLRAPTFIVHAHEFVCDTIKSAAPAMAAVANSGGGVIILGLQAKGATTPNEWIAAGVPVTARNADNAIKETGNIIAKADYFPPFEMGNSCRGTEAQTFYWIEAYTVSEKDGLYCFVVAVARAHGCVLKRDPLAKMRAYETASPADATVAIETMTHTGPIVWQSQGKPACRWQKGDLTTFLGKEEGINGEAYTENKAVEWRMESSHWSEPLSFVKDKLQSKAAELLRANRLGRMAFGIDDTTLMPQALLCAQTTELEIPSLEAEVCETVRSAISDGVFPPPASLDGIDIEFTVLQLQNIEHCVRVGKNPCTAAPIPSAGDTPSESNADCWSLTFSSDQALRAFTIENMPTLQKHKLLLVPVLRDNFYPTTHSSPWKLPKEAVHVCFLLASHGGWTSSMVPGDFRLPKGTSIAPIDATAAADMLLRQVKQVVISVHLRSATDSSRPPAINPDWFSTAAPTIDSSDRKVPPMKYLTFYEIWRKMRGGPSLRSLTGGVYFWVCLTLDNANASSTAALLESGIPWAAIISDANKPHPLHQSLCVPLALVVDTGSLDEESIRIAYNQATETWAPSAALSSPEVVILVGKDVSALVKVAKKMQIPKSHCHVHVLTSEEVGDRALQWAGRGEPSTWSPAFPSEALPPSGQWYNHRQIMEADAARRSGSVAIPASPGYESSLNEYLCGRLPLSWELAKAGADYQRDATHDLRKTIDDAISTLCHSSRPVQYMPLCVNRTVSGAGLRSLCMRSLINILERPAPVHVFLPIIPSPANLNAVCSAAKTAGGTCVAAVIGEPPRGWAPPSGISLVLLVLSETPSANSGITTAPVSPWLSPTEFDGAIRKLTDHSRHFMDGAIVANALKSLQAAEQKEEQQLGSRQLWTVLRTVMSLGLAVRGRAYEPVEKIISDAFSDGSLEQFVLGVSIVQLFGSRGRANGRDTTPLAKWWMKQRSEPTPKKIGHVIDYAPHLSCDPIFAHPLLAEVLIARACTARATPVGCSRAAADDGLTRFKTVMEDGLLWMESIMKDYSALKRVLMGRSCDERFSPLMQGFLAKDRADLAMALVKVIAEKTRDVRLQVRCFVLLGRISLHEADRPSMTPAFRDSCCEDVLKYITDAVMSAPVRDPEIDDDASGDVLEQFFRRVRLCVYPDVALAATQLRFDCSRVLRNDAGDQRLNALHHRVCRMALIELQHRYIDADKYRGRRPRTLRLAKRVTASLLSLLDKPGGGPSTAERQREAVKEWANIGIDLLACDEESEATTLADNEPTAASVQPDLLSPMAEIVRFIELIRGQDAAEAGGAFAGSTSGPGQPSTAVTSAAPMPTAKAMGRFAVLASSDSTDSETD